MYNLTLYSNFMIYSYISFVILLEIKIFFLHIALE